MLEKFLTLFGEDAEEVEQLDGSYLSHLLEAVEPQVREELEQCPEHDPLPLLVALVIRETGGERFEHELECPVVDAESEPLEPPPPPGPGMEGDDQQIEADADGEEGVSEPEDFEDEDSDQQEDRDEAEEESSDDETPGERDEDDKVDRDDEAAADEPAASAETDDEDTDEKEATGDELLADTETEREDLETEVSQVEAAIEAETHRPAEAGMLEEPASPDIDDLRADSDVVLELGRVFLGMLVENDRLPIELQMTPQEADQARQLLAGYFLGDEGLQLRAREMLRLVEEKFDEGMFSQARILLQLFDADESTRIENDRNLFYEDMILRFGIQRRHPVGEEIREQLDERLEELGDDYEGLEELLDWLAETVYVSLDFYGRDSREVERWESLAEHSERPGATERLLEVVPAWRWRALSDFSDSPLDLLDEQLSDEYLADYVTEHVKTCYFILRAVGDTGLEPYLDYFFDWVDEEFDVDGPGIMPDIYNQTTENERPIDEVFADLYVDHFQETVELRRQEWGEEELEEAVDAAMTQFAETELDDVPPGHYDFGRFVLDELFGVEYPTEKFPFQMHRIT